LTIVTSILKTTTLAVVLSVAVAACAQSQETNQEPDAGEDQTMQQPQVKGPQVLLETSMGSILLGFYPDQAPLSVENFLAYVEAGHYDGLVFHRVIPDFMIQAGGHEADLTARDGGRESIRNESDNGLSNARGTIAMARTGDPHSASSQFFINHADNTFLNFGANPQSPNGWGYTVFGIVLEGMDVVDAIAAVQTGNAGGMQNVPVEAVTIVSASVVQP
jgi:cyclophilin family peptidyl-prolyl cis-trans isomerase